MLIHLYKIFHEYLCNSEAYIGEHNFKLIKNQMLSIGCIRCIIESTANINIIIEDISIRSNPLYHDIDIISDDIGGYNRQVTSMS